jgi:hypothetical protein
MRKLLTTMIILSLLLSAMVVTRQITFAKGDPFLGYDWVGPRASTNPPVINMTSPQEGAVYNSSHVILDLNVTIGQAIDANYTRIMQVYYRTDWNTDQTYLYNNQNIDIPIDPNAITSFHTNFNLTQLPEGQRNLTICAVEWGAYIDGSFVHMFNISKISIINFTIDFTIPHIAVLSIENQTYNTVDIPLNFTINKQMSKITYSLDGQANVTVNGNTTLTSLAYGNHTLTLYAKDSADITVASEVIFFQVAKQEPTEISLYAISTVTVIMIAVVVAGITIAVVLRHRKQVKKV